MSKFYSRKTTLLILFLGLFLIGLACARKLPAIHGSWVGLSACIGVSYFIISKKINIFLFVCIAAGIFSAGWFRGSFVMQQLGKYDGLINSQVSIEGRVLEDATYNERGQLSFAVGSITETDADTELIGEVDVEGFGTNAVYRGDIVHVQGRLYRKRGAQVAGVSFARIKVISRSSNPIDSIRREFAAGMQNVLPEPLASFGLGLLIGQRTTLDPVLNDQLIAVGLIHIVAVSGYNLTIIIDGVRRILKKRSRFQIVCITGLLIGVFLLLTGNSPSIVRAAIVSMLSLIAWFFGRKIRPVLLLIFVAALTAGINPLYLWSNIGWYLSFSAFFGVLVLAPLLKQRFITKKYQDKVIPQVLSETIAAQLCTLPIILFIFGRLSTISILANILVVPLVPFAMLFSLISGIVGMLDVFASRLFVLPAEITLEYMLSIAQLLSRIPYANVHAPISAIQLIFLYCVLGLFTIILARRVKQKKV